VLLSFTHPNTLWTEGFSTVIPDACAGRAIEKEFDRERKNCNMVLLSLQSSRPASMVKSWLRKTFHVLSLVSVFLVGSALPALAVAPPTSENAYCGKGNVAQFGDKDGIANSPKPVTTPRSTAHRRRENRFGLAPAPISLPPSNTPSAATRCFCPPEPLST